MKVRCLMIQVPRLKTMFHCYRMVDKRPDQIAVDAIVVFVFGFRFTIYQTRAKHDRKAPKVPLIQIWRR